MNEVTWTILVGDLGCKRCTKFRNVKCEQPCAGYFDIDFEDDGDCPSMEEIK